MTMLKNHNKTRIRLIGFYPNKHDVKENKKNFIYPIACCKHDMQTKDNETKLQCYFSQTDNLLEQLIRTHHKSLKVCKLLLLIFLNHLYLFGSSCFVVAGASTVKSTVVNNDARIDERTASEEMAGESLMSSQVYSSNLNFVNNKSLPSFSLSSVNSDTAPGLNDNSQFLTNGINNIVSSSSTGNGARYLDKIDNLERSVAAVLMKVAYGTTSTTKRSIPDNSFIPSLTTIATPPLTTLRYLEKSQHHQQINLHHRNYELDLERDHALPTSAPNADILKSNSNPTYPNPNRHHNHERDRHHHLLTNSTQTPSVYGPQKKGTVTHPVYSVDMPSYSPPARSFLTPPLPPEYTNPFADKPTLRGTNNEAGISNLGNSNSGTYISRRPIPPPSLMPGQERIPLRPPDLNTIGAENVQQPSDELYTSGNNHRKKALNTPSLKINKGEQPHFESSGVNYALLNSTVPNDNLINPSGSSVNGIIGVFPFQGISRILSGSNGRKEEIPEVLLRTATVRPSTFSQLSPVSHHQTANGQNPNINQSKTIKNIFSDDNPLDSNTSSYSRMDINGRIRHNNTHSNEKNEDNYESLFAAESMPKIKLNMKSTETPIGGEILISSTQVIQNFSNNQRSLLLTTSRSIDNESSKSSYDSPSSKSVDSSASGSDRATWTVAWNIHVYLTAILFTILAVYSIFKMIFYDKLTHLFSQSYFICIHLFLITICMTRIFYLCYDAYNIHSSFHLFVADILLNLPATFLTITFSVLILFLLLRSLNHKNNRYAALIRPLTVVVGSSVHVGLCITLHYVESYTATNNQYYQQMYRTSSTTTSNTRQFLASYPSHNHNRVQMPPSAPRVLSLICQIIYIFVCVSLGLLYLYIYRLLKRVLRSKSQNYIHGYQNLSYAIHITIATALLFILLAALQIYGALSISTTRPLMTIALEIDWLQWGYQFSLRLIEVAIITLVTWVTGLKTGGNSVVLQREKTATGDTHNVSGFALFPCTSSSSQERFDTDYPAICNANTNLHAYTMRTGKPIYDDNFALNSITGGGGNSSSCGSGGGGSTISNSAQAQRSSHDFQLQSVSGGGELIRSYETSSLRSTSHRFHHSHPLQIVNSQSGETSNVLPDAHTDHYENPNFELRSTVSIGRHQYYHIKDNCYSEPSTTGEDNIKEKGFSNSHAAFDFQDFERPKFSDCIEDANDRHKRTHSRSDSTKCNKTLVGLSRDKCTQHNILDRSNYDNPERRSSHSTHSCSSNRNYSCNSFDRRGVRKSGTLSNIGNVHISQAIVAGSSEHASISSQRPFHFQTLNSSHNKLQNNNTRLTVKAGEKCFKQNPNSICRVNDKLQIPKQSAIERSNSGVLNQHHRHQYTAPSAVDTEDFCCINPERANLISNSSSLGGLSSVSSSGQCTVLTEAVRSGSCSTSATLAGNNTPDNVQQTGATSTSTSSSGGDSANSGSMLVAEHGFVRFRALDDINNAQGVGIHNASIRTAISGNSGRHKEKSRCFTNNT